VKISLDDPCTVAIDSVILATDYRVDLARSSMLTSSDLADKLKLRNDLPGLDQIFQSNTPDLCFTGSPTAVRTSTPVIERQFA